MGSITKMWLCISFQHRILWWIFQFISKEKSIAKKNQFPFTKCPSSSAKKFAMDLPILLQGPSQKCPKKGGLLFSLSKKNVMNFPIHVQRKKPLQHFQRSITRMSPKNFVMDPNGIHHKNVALSFLLAKNFVMDCPMHVQGKIHRTFLKIHSQNVCHPQPIFLWWIPMGSITKILLCRLIFTDFKPLLQFHQKTEQKAIFCDGSRWDPSQNSWLRMAGILRMDSFFWLIFLGNEQENPSQKSLPTEITKTHSCDGSQHQIPGRRFCDWLPNKIRWVLPW